MSNTHLVAGIVSFSLIAFAISGAHADSLLPLNSAVTQETIDQTICVKGWTKTVRPPVSYTGPLKHRMMVESGVPPEGEPSIKLDHKIPLTLGGSPESIQNLILQPDDEAKDKDRVEVCLARTVCAGKITLVEAQKAIWDNWRSAGRLCAGYKVIPSD
jgi:hypothetical protein